MTEEMKYYTGNCITDLHTDTSISYCNEERCKQYINLDGLNFCMSSVCPEKDCIYALNNKLYQKIDRLEQENKELSKLIRGTKDYAEVCSVCKDEVTIYPNISGRTDYTQNEVECRTLAQIITQKNNLEQENEELKKEMQAIKSYLGIESKTILERLEELDKWKHNDKLLLWKYHSALEKIEEILLEHSCADTHTTKYITNKINEVLNA